MFVQVTSGKFFRHRIPGTEVDHIQRAYGNHLRDLVADGRFAACGAGSEDAAYHFVAPFRGGEVQHAGEEACVNKRFHCLPACACCVEDKHFVSVFFQVSFGLVNTGSRYTEHGCRD